MPFLDEIDPIAKTVQSVKTVFRKGDKLVGYNTDAIGFRQAISKGIARSGIEVQTAVVYGCGGVSSVVFCVLKELGFEVYVIGRRPNQVSSRAYQFGLDCQLKK